MPLIDPNDDLMMNELVGSVPGLEQELLAEAEEAGVPVDPDDPYAAVRKMSEQMYPVEPLNEGENRELTRLSNRVRRLAPIEPAQFGEVGSSRIPGNPYSIDTRGAAQGVRNLVTGIINKVREKRTGEFEGRLGELAGQRQQNVQNQESQREWLAKMYPDVFGEVQQNKRNEADNATEIAKNTADISKDFALEKVRQSGRQELENLRHQNALELEKLKNTNEGDFSPSIVTNFSNRAKDTGDQLFRQVNAIDEVLNSELDRPQDPEKLKELKEERDRKYRLGFEFMQLGQQALTNGLNRDLQQGADSLYNEAINMGMGKEGSSDEVQGSSEVVDVSDIGW